MTTARTKRAATEIDADTSAEPVRVLLIMMNEDASYDHCYFLLKPVTVEAVHAAYKQKKYEIAYDYIEEVIMQHEEGPLVQEIQRRHREETAAVRKQHRQDPDERRPDEWTLITAWIDQSQLEGSVMGGPSIRLLPVTEPLAAIWIMPTWS